VTPDHVKAILRGAQCSMKVKNGKKFQDCGRSGCKYCYDETMFVGRPSNK